MKQPVKIFICILICTAMLTALTFLPIFGSDGDKRLPGVADAVVREVYLQSSNTPLNAADCAIVIDAASGLPIYEQNADKRRGMASTTKIMTALLTIENCAPDATVKIAKEAVGVEGSSVYLKESEELTVSELLYCLLLESGNDSAAALAIYCGGSLDAFVKMMNDRAAELGLENTHFANPHGLSDAEHYTTVRDLAAIAREAMQYPLFREVVSTKRARVPYDGVANGRSLVNHNKMLFNYSDVIGVKTGYTSADGRCLVSAAERDGLTLIAVTLNDPFPPSTHRALYDSAFDSYESVVVADAGDITVDIPLINGEDAMFVPASNPTTVVLTLPKGAKYEIRLCEVLPIEAPVNKGDFLGEAEVVLNGEVIYIINLESDIDVKEHIKNLWEKIFGR